MSETLLPCLPAVTVGQHTAIDDDPMVNGICSTPPYSSSHCNGHVQDCTGNVVNQQQQQQQQHRCGNHDSNNNNDHDDDQQRQCIPTTQEDRSLWFQGLQACWWRTTFGKSNSSDFKRTWVRIDIHNNSAQCRQRIGISINIGSSTSSSTSSTSIGQHMRLSRRVWVWSQYCCRWTFDQWCMRPCSCLAGIGIVTGSSNHDRTANKQQQQQQQLQICTGQQIDINPVPWHGGCCRCHRCRRWTMWIVGWGCRWSWFRVLLVLSNLWMCVAFESTHGFRNNVQAIKRYETLPVARYWHSNNNYHCQWQRYMTSKQNNDDLDKSYDEDFVEAFPFGDGSASGSWVVLHDLNWRVERMRLEEQNQRRFLKAQPRFLPYQDCKNWVKAWGRWSSEDEWRNWIALGEKRNSYIPSKPDEYYGRLGQWISWEDFLGLSQPAREDDTIGDESSKV